MRPFTITTPKSLLPVANVPLIQYQLILLAGYGINYVVLAVNSQRKKYTELLKTARSLGINLCFSCEKYPLGTAGGIKNACRFLKGNDPFIVFNGDILSDCNLQQMLSFHKSTGADVSIAIVEVANPKDFGVIVIDNERRIQQFIEKPEQPVSNLINAGVYIMQPDILNEIPSGEEVSIEKEIFPHLIKTGRKLFAYMHNGYWMDVGTIEKYKNANFDVIEGKVNFNSGKKLEENTVVAGETVHIRGRICCGKNVVFGKNVEIDGTVIIGDNCFIGENTSIKNAILFRSVMVGRNCLIHDSIIGKASLIEENCEILHSAVADNSRICRHTKIGNI